LVTLYGPLVYGWCRREGLQANDAADVGQEVFWAVARHIGTFHRGPGETFRGWLRTITQHKLIDFLRRKESAVIGMGGDDGVARLSQMPWPEPDPAEDAAETDSLCRRAVELVRSECDERTCQAFWRVVIDGECPAHVAQDLGMAVNAVYLAKSRLLARLRHLLADLGEEKLL
jgi:RNA polymerase sigma-70 factor (ECF subfamily)